MIVLEFRCPELFTSACSLLKARKLQFFAEAALESWRPSVIFLFEEDIRTGPDRKALCQARDFEREDYGRQKPHAWPNLAVPQ